MDFVSWIENSALGVWMIESLWAYPAVLSAHAVGMSIVVGTVLMLDLMLLGFVGEVRLESFSKVFVVTWAGVLLNFLSGIALLCSDPAKFLVHPVFWTKIALMLCGTLSIYLLWRELSSSPLAAAGNFQASARVRGLAMLTMLLWLSVIVAGRLIAYFELP